MKGTHKSLYPYYWAIDTSVTQPAIAKGIGNKIPCCLLLTHVVSKFLDKTIISVQSFTDSA